MLQRFLFRRYLPNGWRYWQVRELAGKTARRRIRRWGRIPESVGKARTCPVHALLALLAETEPTRSQEKAQERTV